MSHCADSALLMAECVLLLKLTTSLRCIWAEAKIAKICSLCALIAMTQNLRAKLRTEARGVFESFA